MKSILKRAGIVIAVLGCVFALANIALYALGEVRLEKLYVIPDKTVSVPNVIVPSIPQAPTQTPTIGPSKIQTLVQAPTTVASPMGKLYGPFDWVPDGTPYTLTRLSSTASLDEAQSQGVKVLFAPSWWSRVRDSNGCLDVQKWKSDFDADVPSLQPYVDDGTVIGIYALDEPHDQGCIPTKAQLTELCDYSKSRFPGLSCGYNAPPDFMEGVGVDYLFTQTNFIKTQDWGTWAQAKLNEAAWFNGPVYLSINAYTGNPSAEQIENAAIALCQSNAAGVMMWKWDFLQDYDLSRAIFVCYGIRNTPK